MNKPQLFQDAMVPGKTVNAVMLSATNIHEVMQWSHGRPIFRNGTPRRLSYGVLDNIEAVARSGDWIVEIDPERFIPMVHDDFFKRYMRRQGDAKVDVGSFADRMRHVNNEPLEPKGHDNR